MEALEREAMVSARDRPREARYTESPILSGVSEVAPWRHSMTRSRLLPHAAAAPCRHWLRATTAVANADHCRYLAGAAFVASWSAMRRVIRPATQPAIRPAMTYLSRFLPTEHTTPPWPLVLPARRCCYCCCKNSSQLDQYHQSQTELLLLLLLLLLFNHELMPSNTY